MFEGAHQFGISWSTFNNYSSQYQSPEDLGVFTLKYPMLTHLLTIVVCSAFNELKSFCTLAAAYDHDSNPHIYCHPQTRLDVLHELHKWATSPSATIFCWLRGLAGSGKSTIVHTFCTQCANQKMLGASFFFRRASVSQRSARNLFPTIAFQLATVIPGFKTAVCFAIRNDPTIFSKSFNTQMQRLLLEPLLTSLPQPPISILLVMDALDECSEASSIREAVRILDDLAHKLNLTLRILLTGRPEKSVRDALDSPMHEGNVTVLDLQEQDNSTDDIRLFITQSFQDIRRRNQDIINPSLPWPSEHQLNAIIRRSSDLFAYAACIVKYVNADNSDPKARLNDILNTKNNTQNSVYGDLDDLYIHILTEAKNATFPHSSPHDICEPVCAVMALIAYSPVPISRSLIKGLMRRSVSNGFVPLLTIRHLQSIILLCETPDDSTPVKFYHESVRDFLADRQRSGTFFVGKEEGYDLINLMSFNHMRFIPPAEAISDLTLGHICWMYARGFEAFAGTSLRRNYFVGGYCDLVRYGFSQDVIACMQPSSLRVLLTGVAMHAPYWEPHEDSIWVPPSIPEILILIYCHCTFAIFDVDNPPDIIRYMLLQLFPYSRKECRLCHEDESNIQRDVGIDPASDKHDFNWLVDVIWAKRQLYGHSAAALELFFHWKLSVSVEMTARPMLMDLLSFGSSQDNRDHSGDIILQSLEKLTVVTADASKHLFNRLQVPVLRALRVESSNWARGLIHHQELERLLRRSTCTARSLKLDDPNMDEDYLLVLLQQETLQHLQCLDIQQPMVTSTLPSLLTPDYSWAASPTMPELRTLRLGDCHSSDQNIAKLVRTRTVDAMSDPNAHGVHRLRVLDVAFTNERHKHPTDIKWVEHCAERTGLDHVLQWRDDDRPSSFRPMDVNRF
ncbi:hypothetical protein HGRIS_008898 [Hohenbuehelia grisea]|uniref:Nephrocystin 3-like N-terminal domain-containing protein n=1 Tax=Hohenbuehelia grisea TaxID=104357 RepID=A0ABR3IZX2_9AGAR